MDLAQLAALALAGFAGGLVDSIAGGGGLITLPALLWAGLPNTAALATNKFQSACGTTVSVITYARAGLIPWREAWLGALASFAASVAGALAVTWLAPDFLRSIIPWLLIAIALWMALKPAAVAASRPRMGWAAFSLGVAGALGFYDGFFGPGAGSFLVVALTTLRGLELRTATGVTKILNLASNLGSLLLFLLCGQVWFGVGLAMIAGQLLGARLGARLVVRRGTAIVRPLLIIVSLALAVRLFWLR